MARASSRRYMQWVGDVSGGGNFAFRLLLVYWSRNPMVVFDSSGCCVLADFVWFTARHFPSRDSRGSYYLQEPGKINANPKSYGPKVRVFRDHKVAPPLTHLF